MIHLKNKINKKINVNVCIQNNYRQIYTDNNKCIKQKNDVIKYKVIV